LGRKPLPSDLRKKQFNVALDDSMRAQLEKIATERDITVADDIRRRIADSLRDEEEFDRLTRWLMLLVGKLAKDVQIQTGHAWWKHPKSHEALAAAIDTLLADKPRPVEGEDTWPPDDPQTLGRTIARARRGSVGTFVDHEAEIHDDIRAQRAEFAEMRGRFDKEKAALRAQIEALKNKRGPKKR
jgi:hypothetical protein